ncbi:adenosylcobyric acid synthase (glutamine-hydrolysing) [Cognatiyoonia koreensis]|uniref:Cobyric acid synthase n=1 Tax=Cognatiyoonia koreensis TaxID=364200 RepID=A0A1I0QG77_9RHOB|nr:cobyric acid synthase [Cognatiyoonia koreensis]SEW25971.1 adenosylcobyric acid synthase (glutamine-hydrolysing) [Cognatiyoonia koreensis]
MTKAIMIQGAGSNVGKSMLVAGIARAWTQQGLRVAPFKPQNMSNNAAVTIDGGEIGRAQALQAMAAGRDPIVDMNPVLLKPESEIGAQVVVQGQRLATVKAREYGKMKATLLPKVLESFYRLAKTADVIIVEGAGSPAEVNLRAGDIANMGFASAARVPVALIGDIDRGGVIAQLVGTHAVLPEDDRALIKAFGINKFRGDTSLFSEGLEIITARTGWASLGIVPWFADAWKLPAEDVMDIASRPGGGIKIAVPRLNRIANFDDLDPLSAMPEVTVDVVPAGRPLPADADLILIPGSKSTIADLAHFRAQGWDIDLQAHVRRGGRVLGICGGYQMLGKTIIDADGIEGAPATVQGLGLLDVVTEMKPEKRLALTDATYIATGDSVAGYEIHIGQTDGPDRARAWLDVDGRSEGATSPDGLIRGCYLHGLFAADAFRCAFLQELGKPVNQSQYGATVSQTLDDLAAHLTDHMDLARLFDLAEEV